MLLSVQDLSKVYESHAGAKVAAMNSVSFNVQKGEVFTLLGPSGCGKTTTLQCVAGLEQPTAGRIEMGGKIVFCGRKNLWVPANKRKLGMVFQSYAIWPHLSVFENVAFPLLHGQTRLSQSEVNRRTLKALDMVKLSEFSNRPSPHLSGGQQQRVALARALVHEPQLLLLDEPLSNLDAKLRDVMRVEIRQLVKELGITTLLVTHDQTEALSMSDRILLMRHGHVIQQGTPQEIFLRPNSRFVADFLGRSNILPGNIGDCRGSIITGMGELFCDQQEWFEPQRPVYLVVRPQFICIESCPDRPSGVNVVSAIVERQYFLGDAVEVVLATDVGIHLKVLIDPYRMLEVGARTWLRIPPDRCVVVPIENSEEAMPPDTNETLVRNHDTDEVVNA